VAEFFEAIDSVNRLEEMADWVIDSNSWNEFLQAGM
jgi:hypothetical protein